MKTSALQIAFILQYTMLTSTQQPYTNIILCRVHMIMKANIIAGVQRFCCDLEVMMGPWRSLYWKLCWTFITPAGIIVRYLHYPSSDIHDTYIIHRPISTIPTLSIVRYPRYLHYPSSDIHGILFTFTCYVTFLSTVGIRRWHYLVFIMNSSTNFQAPPQAAYFL